MPLAGFKLSDVFPEELGATEARNGSLRARAVHLDEEGDGFFDCRRKEARMEAGSGQRPAKNQS